jgi:hypothetical protein
MLLAARELGLGATPTTLYLQFEKEAEAALGLPPGYTRMPCCRSATPWAGLGQSAVLRSPKGGTPASFRLKVGEARDDSARNGSRLGHPRRKTGLPIVGSPRILPSREGREAQQNCGPLFYRSEVFPVPAGRCTASILAPQDWDPAFSRKAIMGEIATGEIYLSVTDNPSVLPARSRS